MATERNPFLGTIEFNSGATGSKRYGPGQTSSATSGPLSSDGYSERERKRKARQLAIQNRLQQNGAAGTMGATQGGY